VNSGRRAHAGDEAGRGRSLVSLIMVTYQSAPDVVQAIGSVEASAEAGHLGLEVIVIDNASRDASADRVSEAFPGATVVRNEENVGFGRACNHGFELARGDWWLLLNPDARLEPEALGRLVEFAAGRERAGAVGATLLGAGTDRAESAGMQPGIRSALGHFLLLNRLLPGDVGGAWRGLQLHRRQGLGPRRVDWTSAGAVLLRPAAVRDVGGFDPRYFLYAEDVDLGRRLAERGWQTWLLPDALASHAVAASQGGVTDRWLVALHDHLAREVSRPRLVAFDAIALLGLASRAVTAGATGLSDADRLHARRMRVAAFAALRLLVRDLAGR
jgi:hypothetical protein